MSKTDRYRIYAIGDIHGCLSALEAIQAQIAVDLIAHPHHTPVDEVENHGNWIAVDSGAVFGRKLSCVVLEDDAQHLLTPAERVPLPVGHGL